jgi:hypothetical protein
MRIYEHAICEMKSIQNVKTRYTHTQNIFIKIITNKNTENQGKFKLKHIVIKYYKNESLSI